MFDVKNSVIQIIFENSDLEFDHFKAALDEAIQSYAPTKKVVYLSKPSAFNE